MSRRTATVDRVTRETRVHVSVDLDAPPAASIETGLPFFDHMLEQLARHGRLALSVAASGDLSVDDHHLVEDVAIALGETLAEALGDKAGLTRYGSANLPMDEALASVALDLSGRPVLVFQAQCRRPALGGLSTEMVPHFFRTLSVHGGLTLHMHSQGGDNDHHTIEALFKAFGRALRAAITPDPHALPGEAPSTKGTLAKNTPDARAGESARIDGAAPTGVRGG